MSGVHLVRLADVPPQPWRNGGGLTRELLAWPVGAAEWALRVSVADITRDGPFSPFPGVQRCFTVLEGAGVVLGFSGRGHRLTPQADPLAFDGAEAPACTLIDGPTRDLNLMALNTAGRSAMQPATAPLPASPRRRWQGVYITTAARLHAAGREHALPPGTLAWAEAPAGAWQLHADTGAALRAWWLTLDTPDAA